MDLWARLKLCPDIALGLSSASGNVHRDLRSALCKSDLNGQFELEREARKFKRAMAKEFRIE